MPYYSFHDIGYVNTLTNRDAIKFEIKIDDFIYAIIAGGFKGFESELQDMFDNEHYDYQIWGKTPDFDFEDAIKSVEWEEIYNDAEAYMEKEKKAYVADFVGWQKEEAYTEEEIQEEEEAEDRWYVHVAGPSYGNRIHLYIVKYG